jgi:dTDP-glucose 4,6-dehydratase
VRACHRTYGLQTTVSHACNNYGPFQFPEKLVPAMITNALRGHALPVYADGSQRRDWLHVDDHCAAISAIVARGRIGETYNVGAGAERANLDLVHALCELLDERFAEHPRLARQFPAAPPARHGARCSDLIAFVADRPGHDWRYAIDSGRLRHELQFAPSIDLASGLRCTVDWYLQNAAWWESVLAGTHRRDLPPPVASKGA